MDTAKHIQKQLSGVSGFSQSLGATRSLLRRQLWMWPVIAALLLGGVGWLVHRSVENAMRKNLAGGLTTILNADVEALRQWLKGQNEIARALARLPDLRPAVRELLTTTEQPDTASQLLHQSRALTEVRTRLAPFLENFAYSDFLVVSLSMRAVGAKGDAPINGLLDGYRAEFCRKVLNEGSSVSKPFHSTLLLPDADGQLKAGLPTMYAAAVIPDDNGKPLALLGLRIRPEADFTRILQTARFAASGETYVISNTGLLLSKSRFDSDLKRLGLLTDVADAQSILTRGSARPRREYDGRGTAVFEPLGAAVDEAGGEGRGRR
jgi:hypothetical protein